MHNDELNELMSDGFLDGLDEKSEAVNDEENPGWVSSDVAHTTYRAWKAIMQLKSEKEGGIKSFRKLATQGTAKSLYEIKKSEVSKVLGNKPSPQSIFRTSSFSSDILAFFKDANAELLEIFEKEQKKQLARSKKTGIRVKKKEVIVSEVQQLLKKVEELECRQVKDTLDLLLNNMPLDLRQRLKRGG